MKYSNGDHVQFFNTSDSELDSITGTVVGITSNDAYASHYIVLLDKKYSQSEWDAISITEHCLKPMAGFDC